MGGGVDISLPNVSYCEDVKDIHYNPYNTVEFYVGNITGTTPQTVSIYTNSDTSIPIQVSEGNKWYTYVLPKNKGLYTIESGYFDDEDSTWNDGIVTKVTVKADINFEGKNDYYTVIIPLSTIEASFKGSNTSNVTDMGSMFSGCTELTSLDVSSFDTSIVTDMRYMFSYCYGLTSLDVSSFNTSNVTDMNNMFSYCYALTSLDLSSFNTSKVTDMNNMFNACYRNLKSLDLSSFKTSNVTNMSSMFNGCSSLEELDLSGWVISDATNTSSMFYGCSKLSTITMKNCSEATRTKIQNQLTKDNITGVTIVTK